ncbi:MAG: 5-methyltetrahydropteroyltriglutamate--homocysteine S-methyltransferase, partial [Acidimicrobiales bacterium]
LPTTTIGSFPQTVELRAARAARNAGRLDEASYRSALESEVDHVISLQEDVGLDVLVHGEPERDDMVRYFAAQLEGFALAGADWVQSYGSRCVRPPVLFGDVRRAHPMSVDWFSYAQSKTDKPVKGMLTGPITMLAWSFVRDDQPPADTAAQIALAFAQEVQALEAAGAGIIQVDEPALRELLPLRRRERPAYLDWATRAIRLTTAAASPSTQVHTHMCYAHFAEIAGALADMEVDVISFEAARSKLAPMQGIVAGHFEGGLGPGTYDVHSPRVPTTDEIAALLRTAAGVLGPTRVWANPDCGLKTRAYPEVEQSLRNLVEAAHQVREELMAQ